MICIRFFERALNGEIGCKMADFRSPGSDLRFGLRRLQILFPATLKFSCSIGRPLLGWPRNSPKLLNNRPTDGPGIVFFKQKEITEESWS
jgi:hypothetical protein